MRTRGNQPRRAREPAPTYNSIKRRWTQDIAFIALTTRGPLPPADGQKVFRFCWYEPNRKRDPDGIAAGGTKLILDGFIEAGIIKTDGARHVAAIHHQFFYEAPGGGRVFVGIEWGSIVQWTVLIPHVLPDLNELLAAREVGARISQARRFAR